jgi:alpha-glucosidase
MAKAPVYVRDFLKKVPVVWDDMKFIDGFPGQYVVVARRAGKIWYVAGINADRQPRKVKIDLKALGVAKQGTLITDGLDFLGFKSEYFPLEKGVTSDEITMRPRGGFVLTFD